MCFYIKNPNVAKYLFKGSNFIENVISHPDVILLDSLYRRLLCLKWPAVMNDSLYFRMVGIDFQPQLLSLIAQILN